MTAARRLARFALVPGTLCLAVGMSSASATLAATGWERVPTVHAGGNQGQDFLSGVAVDAMAGAWAVGEFFDGASRSHSLLIRWDGTSWHQVASPNPGGFDAGSKNSLDAVTVADDGTGFAVGKWWDTSNSGPLLMRTRHGAWVRDVVPGPYTELYGVSALSASEAWAVGADHYRAATFHWNGSSWTKVPVPYPGGAVLLSSVAEISPHDVWAAGSIDLGDVPARMFLIHWDGHSWTRAPHMHGEGYLSAITARNAHDIWAVGSRGGDPGEVPLALHFNGQSWSSTVTEHVSGRNADSSFGSAVVVGKHKVWAVGQWDRVTAVGTHALIEKWNGSSWSIVPNPRIGDGANDSKLHGIAAGAGHLWAVGDAWPNALTLYRP